MKWSTAYVDSLPDSAFAFVASDGSRHLPYKNADGRVDLPHVRDALSRLNEVDNMSASERSAVKDKLQGSLKASDSDDDVMSYVSAIKAADGEQLPSKMMLLRAGVFNTQKYGEVPLTAADLQEMADNFKAGIGMAGDGTTGIPVDYAHQSNLNAAAWIKDMEVQDGKELWATSIEWSGSGKKAIQDKEYKCLSSDFYPAPFGEWVDAESGVRAKNVIVGAALTNRPMFTGNQPVVASETTDKDGNRQTTKYVIASEKEQSMNIDEVRVKAAEDLTGAEQRFLQASADKLSADEKKKFDIVEPVAAADANKDDKVIQASDVTGNEGTVKIEASEVKAMNDRIVKLEASEEAARKSQVEAEVDKHIERGAIKADQKDKWTGLILADESNKDLLAGLADNPLLAKEQGAGDADADGNGGASARSQLMAHATELMKKPENKLTDIKAAYALAKEQHPELVEASAAESKSRLTASDEQFAAAGVNRG